MVEKELGHWQIEGHTQRMAGKHWRELLLAHEDDIIVNGVLRKLKARHLGLGVYEIYKEPLKEISNG